jgi:hypothetical protein
MKNKHIIIIGITSAVLLYLIFAFGNCGFDISDWDVESRVLCSFGFLTIVILTVLGIIINEDDSKGT